MFLFKSPYAIIARLPGTTIIRFKRLNATTRSVAETREQLQRMIDALNSVDRSIHHLLMDTRDAPTRHAIPEAEFEKVLDEFRKQLMIGFAKVAVLVKTSVGKLQVTRMTREDGVDARVFEDEAEALAYLSGRAEAR
jgi:hypothetical protein